MIGRLRKQLSEMPETARIHRRSCAHHSQACTELVSSLHFPMHEPTHDTSRAVAYAVNAKPNEMRSLVMSDRPQAPCMDSLTQFTQLVHRHLIKSTSSSKYKLQFLRLSDR